MMKSLLLLIAAGGGLALAHTTAGEGVQPPRPEGGEHAAPSAPRFTPPTRQQIALRMMVRNLLLQKYDLNQDHELDEEERAALLRDARETMRRQAEDKLRRFDQDGDGRLNKHERVRMRESLSCPAEEGCTPQPDSLAPPAAPHHPQQASPDGRPEGRAPGLSPRKGPSAPPADGPGPDDLRPNDPPPAGNPGGPSADAPDGAPGPRPRRPHMDKSARLVAFMAQHLIMAAYDTNHNGQLDAEEHARIAEDGEWLYTTREAALLKQYDTDGDGRLSEEELNAALQTLLPDRPTRPQRMGRTPGPQGGRGKADAPDEERVARDEPQGRGRKSETRRRNSPPPPRNAIDRMLDTHFDVDILLHLAHPDGAKEAAPTPSPNA